MRNILFIAVAAVMMLSSCARTGDLEVVFKASYDGAPLVMNSAIDYAWGEKIQLSKTEFLISDIELIDSKGNTVELTDVMFIDLTSTHQNADDAAIGISFPFEELPTGTYTSINFGVGVPANLNAMQPGDFEIDHPLGNGSYYWSGWSSYIFSKTEGRIDTLGGDNFDLNFLYHTGSDDLYREISVPINLDIAADATTTLSLDVDHKSIFYRDGNAMDIKTEPLSHSPGQSLDFPTFIMDNFVVAISEK